MTDIIIPFFDKYKIIGVKSEDFEDFKKVTELMKNKAHLTAPPVEGLEKIRLIKIAPSPPGVEWWIREENK